MQSNHLAYSHTDSVARIDEVLDSSDTDYTEMDSIPSRDSLTFKNGYYASCSALFIDLRGSSSLPDKHKRPRLAKIYRAYISECVAVINGVDICREINIQGDSVWGIFDTPLKANVNTVFSVAARLASLMRMLNCRLAKRGIDRLSAGIGHSDGRALMIKAGYKGSAINDVVWMGDVVNHASKLCHAANRWPTKEVLIANVVYDNLTDENKALMAKNWNHDCYEGDIVNVVMDAWYDSNCDGY